MCLLCRQEARVAAADRRKKLLLRGTALAIVIAVIGLGMSGALSLRDRVNARQEAAADSARQAAAAVAVVPPQQPESIVPQGQLPAAATSVPTTSAAPAPVVPAPAAAVPEHRDAPLQPTVRVGETPLGAGATATRGDSGVIVTFDTPELRTRLPEKFERYVRATLPQVYGPRVDTILAAIPAGKLTAQGDLLYELPVRGIQIPLQSGWRLDVFPDIRPGRDGPLVVRYRASVVKN